MCPNGKEFKYSFNKATIFSWFIHIRKNLDIEMEDLKSTISNFEFCRAYIKGKYKKVDNKYMDLFLVLQKKVPFFEVMLNTFNQRTSMGSTDALSIIYRDIIIELFRDMILSENSELMQYTVDTFATVENFNYTLEKIVELYDWGEKF